ncbi:hypothetical protein YC2023_066410 [Brassica napus]
MRLQTGSASLPTAALKPTDLPLPSAPMPSGHQSPQDLGDDLYMCVSMNQEHITITSCAILTGHTHKSFSIALSMAKSSSSTRISDGQRTLLMYLKHHSNSSKDKTLRYWYQSLTHHQGSDTSSILYNHYRTEASFSTLNHHSQLSSILGQILNISYLAIFKHPQVFNHNTTCQYTQALYKRKELSYSQGPLYRSLIPLDRF